MARLYAGVAPRCSISPPFPSSRLAKRRTNRLREKLLKTLGPPRQPLSISLPPTQETIHRREEWDGTTLDDSATVVSTDDRRIELSIGHSPTPSEVLHGVSDPLPRVPVLRWSLQLVGIFIFQTICAVWFLGAGHSDEEARDKGVGGSKNLESSKLRGGEMKGNNGLQLQNGGGRFSEGLGSNLGKLHANADEDLDEKISKIRAMAREARLMERLEMGRNGDVIGGLAAEEDKEVVPPAVMDSATDTASPRTEKNQIEGEVDELLGELPQLVRSRLRKLPPKSYLARFAGAPRRRMNRNNVVGNRGSSPLPAKDELAKSGSDNPKGGSAEPVIREKPRGFQNTGGVNKKGNKAHIEDGVALNSKTDKRTKERNSSLGRRKGDAKQVEHKSFTEPFITSSEERESSASCHEAVGRLGNGGDTAVSGRLGSYNSEGSLQDNLTKVNGMNKINDAYMPSVVTHDPSPMKDVETKKVNVENRRSGQSMKENTAKPARSGSSALLKHNNGSQQRLQTKEDKHKSQLHDTKHNQSKENEFWWLSLPYVHVIFLHRGVGDTRAKGLYSLKLHHGADNDAAGSHIIAFQDRGDATNFCFLLESLFKDLGDAYADVVPLSIKELHGEVKSGSMNVKVVRKGELKLYVGQPLEEVERKLRSL
ncbi:uncharacterized protein LOC116254984 [Nymphaea colorata]|nr:uncharacterized protein LOC116254984 [Nymphaea colorata]